MIMWRTAELTSTSARPVNPGAMACDTRAGNKLRRHMRRGGDRGRGDPRQRDLLPGRCTIFTAAWCQEIAGPATHLELIDTVLQDALRRAEASLDDIALIAATRGPGLVSALLVGASTAKAVAAARALPFAGVDHLHGHVAASFLQPAPFDPPFLCLIANGGHTLIAHVRDRGPNYAVLGQTLDDAAGEAFDKGARLLGLGYPGGAALERLARDGDPEAFTFPTASKLLRACDFSFAGLKTALLYRVRDLGEAEAERRRADLAASYQHAIVQSLALRRQARSARDRARAAGDRRRGGRQRTAARAACSRFGAEDRTCRRARAVHRQRRDDRERGPVRACDPFPDYLGVDVYATGERALAA